MAKEKRRGELCVAVPSLFRCPISMDVMKSPVSLCTGVTYDRSSIEKWLALGHNTCPATMQTLPSTNTTPNLTLRSLIQSWLSQSEVSDSSSSLSTAEMSNQEVMDTVNGNLDPVALEKIISFITASEENLKFVAQSCDAISRFVEIFAKTDEVRVSELIIEILDLISMENGVIGRLNELILKNGGESNCLSSFTFVLQKGRAETKVRCAKILELIAVNPKSQRVVAEKPGLLYELHNLITADSSQAVAGLAAISAISNSRPAKKELIRLGMVRTVGNILSGCDTTNGARAVIEKALEMLQMIATCTEGRSAICEDEECVAGIVNRLMKCSGVAAERGVGVLWSLCCLGRDPTVEEKVVGLNGLTRVLLVLQSDCSEGTRSMCRELVKVLRGKNGKSNLAPYHTRTTHITPY